MTFDSPLLEKILNPGSLCIAYEGTAFPPDHLNAAARVSAVHDAVVGANGWGTTPTLTRVNPPAGSKAYGLLEIGCGTEADFASGAGVSFPRFRCGDGYAHVLDTYFRTPAEAVDYLNFQITATFAGTAKQVGLIAGWSGPGTTTPAAWKSEWYRISQDTSTTQDTTKVIVAASTYYRITLIMEGDGKAVHMYIDNVPVVTVDPTLNGMLGDVLYANLTMAQAAPSGMVNHKMVVDYVRYYRLGTPADAAKGAVTLTLPNNTTRLDHYDT